MTRLTLKSQTATHGAVCGMHAALSQRTHCYNDASCCLQTGLVGTGRCRTLHDLFRLSCSFEIESWQNYSSPLAAASDPRRATSGSADAGRARSVIISVPSASLCTLMPAPAPARLPVASPLPPPPAPCGFFIRHFV